jgi:hypothetical protein
MYLRYTPRQIKKLKDSVLLNLAPADTSNAHNAVSAKHINLPSATVIVTEIIYILRSHVIFAMYVVL